MKRLPARLATITAMSTLVAAAIVPITIAPVAASAEENSAPRIITFDFDEASLGLLVKFFSQITGKNIVLAEGVSGDEKFTIVAEQKVSVDEAWQIFVGALEARGLETSTEGDDVRIVGSSRPGSVQP